MARKVNYGKTKLIEQKSFYKLRTVTKLTANYMSIVWILL